MHGATVKNYSIKVYLFTDWCTIELSKKKIFKIYIKIDTKTAPTYFGLITIVREGTIRSC